MGMARAKAPSRLRSLASGSAFIATLASLACAPPGGDVRVREVRFGDTVLSDTALLRFDDPGQAFTVTYEITDLGPVSDGELAPTPLLADAGGPIGGLHSILRPLTIAPIQTGTFASSRFTDALFGPGTGGKEQTRQGVQQIT